MPKSTILILTLLLAIGAFADKPNLLVIFTDDQTFRAIGYNNPEVKTPHLDALAAKGVIFDNAYVASPICAASRASMMTGVFPQQHGVIALSQERFATYKSNGKHASQTLPRQLAAAGYHSAFYGKSHLGSPQDYGFQSGKIGRKYDDQDTFADAQAFIKSAATANQPFFLWVAPRQPHVPLKPAQKWLALYDTDSLSLAANFRVKPTSDSINNQGTPGQSYYRDGNYRKNWRQLAAGPPRDEATIRQFIKAYYATISNLDHQVGELMQSLKTASLADNTVIVFLSDNGYHLGSHGLGNKITMHEESVRVPMFIVAPGLAKAGNRSQALVSSLDVYPTLLQLAGAEIPVHAMGKSLVPILKNPTATVRDVVFSECTGVGGKPGDGHRMARSATWKYVLSDTNQQYLFDQTADPYELTNRINNAPPPETHQHLQRALTNWMQTIGDRPHPESK